MWKKRQKHTNYIDLDCAPKFRFITVWNSNKNKNNKKHSANEIHAQKVR